MNSPLIDTLFRPTTPPPPRQRAALASAAPIRAAGVHTRAGNAMSRTRSALLAGAAQAVAASGTKITMAQVAAAAGVAKATLYNHLRTREAVLDALVADQVQQLIDANAGKPLDQALHDTALAITGNPVRRALAQTEPAVLARLARLDDTADGWRRARAAVTSALADAQRGGADTVLRWLCSFLVSDATPRAVAEDVQVLLAGLPAASRPADAAFTPDRRPDSQPADQLGSEPFAQRSAG